jgi:hypothetical protein
MMISTVCPDTLGRNYHYMLLITAQKSTALLYMHFAAEA